MNMNNLKDCNWHKLCITDKSEQEYFKCTASPMSTMSEIRNLQRHIEQAKQRPDMYKMLDSGTAVVMLDGSPYGDAKQERWSDAQYDDILKELGL